MSYYWGRVPRAVRPMHFDSSVLPMQWHCHLSTALMTDQDLLQWRWDYVTTIMTFPTNSMENSSFLVSSQHPLRSSSFSKTKQPRFLHFHFQPAKPRAEPWVCKAAFCHLLHKIQPQKSIGSVTVSKWAARMLEQMLILLLHSISFYLQLYLHCILQSCKIIQSHWVLFLSYIGMQIEI